MEKIGNLYLKLLEIEQENKLGIDISINLILKLMLLNGQKKRTKLSWNNITK